MLILRKRAWTSVAGNTEICVSLSIFKLILQRLDDVTLYFRDSRVFVDMHELEMMVHRCSKWEAHAIISRSYQDRTKDHISVDIKNIQISCYEEDGKLSIELHHALEYILAQIGPIPPVMRRALIEVEIALDAAAEDVDVFYQIVEHLLKGRMSSRVKPKGSTRWQRLLRGIVKKKK